MNCAGSERAESNKGFDCRNMGEVLGKEYPKAETSFGPSPEESLRDVGDGGSSSALSESESDKDQSVDSDEDTSWLLSFSENDLSINMCKCEGCFRRNESLNSEKTKAKLLLSSWKEFQSYIRRIYINFPFHIDENDRLQEIIQVLRLCDPYQLFLKIEEEFRAMVIQEQVSQLNLLKYESNPALAEMFITGLVEKYMKLLVCASKLSHATDLILGPQLEKFGLSFEMLSRHLYQSLIYTHYDVQENLPQFIRQLRTELPLKDALYQESVHQFIEFDNEMTGIEAPWKKVEVLMDEYRKFKAEESETVNSLQDVLKTIFSGKPDFENGNVDGSSDSTDEASQYCPNCLTKKGCPCDECMIIHIMSCEGIESPLVPDSPESRSMSPVKDDDLGSKDDMGVNQQQTCECHACTVPPPELMDCSAAFNQATGKSTHGEGFQLYPHIHGTVSECLQEADNICSMYSQMLEISNIFYPTWSGTPFATNSVATPPQVEKPISNAELIQPEIDEEVKNQSPVSTINQPETAIKSQLTNTTSIQPSCPPPPLPQPQPEPPAKRETPKEIPKPAESVKVKEPVPQKQNSNTVGENIKSAVLEAKARLEPKKNPVEVKPPGKESEANAKTAGDKSKVLGNNKGSPCVISRLCGKCCLRHGPDCSKYRSCGKNSEKNLATITKIGLSSNANQRQPFRCPYGGAENEHTHRMNKTHSYGKIKCYEYKKTPNGTGEVNGQEPDDSSSQDDTCSERSNSTSASTPKDSRHCDCCYCEVFGHSVPSVAPVSRNYQEIRERLRLRLNNKRTAKCKAAATGQSNKTVQPGEKPATETTKSTAGPGDGKKGIVGDEDLETLLNYIEGKKEDENKDSKKSGKKSRQKQKKPEEKGKSQQEEEADRKRLEAMKRQVTISVVNDNNKKTQNSKQHPQQSQTAKTNNKNSSSNSNHNNNSQQSNNSSKSKSNSSSNQHHNSNNNNSNNVSNSNSNQNRNSQTLNLSGLKSLVEKSDPNSGPKMVTIRRVMAPFSAEPTVTITLKGSTPDKDKVLFMLKNESESYQPEEKEPTKKSRKRRKKLKKAQEYYEEEEEYEEPYFEEEPEPEPVEEKRSKRKKRNKNKNAESQNNVIPHLEPVKETGKKSKNSKNEIAKDKSKSQSSGKSKDSGKSQSGGQKTNSKSDSGSKNVPVLKSQTAKKSETNSKSVSKNSNSKNNSSASGKSGKNAVSSVGSSAGNKNSKNAVVAKQSVAVNNSTNEKCRCSASQRNQSGKNQTVNANTTGSNAKQSSKSKKSEEVAKGTRQQQNSTVQCKGKAVDSGKGKSSVGNQTKSGKNVEKPKQDTRKQQEGKKNKAGQKSVVESHDMNSRFTVGDRYDRGKVVINTPSYRLSEVLSSIAPSPPPKEEINLENLRLPPGITITKIEGPITKSIRASEQPLHVSKPVPMTPPIVVSTPALKQNHPPPPGNVIVVDTGRLKEVIKENAPNPSSQTTGSSGSKKKKKRNKQNAENAVPAVDVPQQKYNVKMPKGNPLMGKSGVTVISADEARKMVPSLENQQATIIKTSDNMVTIRSPAFQQAMNMHAYQNSPNYRPGINGYNNVNLFRNDMDRITDSIGKLKLSPEDKLARQMRNLNIKEGSRASQIFAQAMAAAERTGQEPTKKKKKKRKQNHKSDEKEVEPVESVFQPKDIDLENGDIDDDERELEAFKRFCLQSVPSERKNKVKVNLNIKDIVLKKKSSAIGCS